MMSIRNGIVHPTINYETPDPQCDLDYIPNQVRQVDVKAAMSNSLPAAAAGRCALQFQLHFWYILQLQVMCVWFGCRVACSEGRIEDIA